MANFAEVQELALDFDLDAKTERIAQRTLDSLSEQARFYGRPWADPEKAPAMVKHIVLDAAQRHMSNYEGYTTSRAGDETLGWTDRGEDSGSAYFTQREISQLRKLGGRDEGLTSMSVYTWSNRAAPRDQYVRLATGDTMAYVAAEEAELWGWDE